MSESVRNIKVEVLEDVPAAEWDSFTQRAKGGSFFSLYEYYKVENAKVFYVVAYDGQHDMVGGIVARLRATTFPASLIAKTLWVESGLLILGLEGDAESEVKKLMLRALAKEAQRRGCVSIRFNHWCWEEHAETFEQSGFVPLPNPTFVSSLALSEQELFSLPTRERRQTIKKGIASGLTVQFLSQCDREIMQKFHGLYAGTQQRAVARNRNSSMNVRSLEFLEGIFREKRLPAILAFTCAENQMAAAGVFVDAQSTLIHFISASDLELNRKYGASSFLMWKTMLWAKERGMCYFDFGGVPVDPNPTDPAYGVYNFKKGFGGDLKTYWSGYKVISPIRERLVDLMMKNRSVLRALQRIVNIE